MSDDVIATYDGSAGGLVVASSLAVAIGRILIGIMTVLVASRIDVAKPHRLRAVSATTGVADITVNPLGKWPPESCPYKNVGRFAHRQAAGSQSIPPQSPRTRASRIWTWVYCVTMPCVARVYTPCIQHWRKFVAEVGLRIRVDDGLRRDFIATCKMQDTTAAQVLRAFMRGYIEEHGEAVRQGRLFEQGYGPGQPLQSGAR